MQDGTREHEEAQRLAEYRKAGVQPTYRAVIELENGGSICQSGFVSKQVAESMARLLRNKYEGTAAVAGSKVAWLGAELDSVESAKRRWRRGA